MRGYADAGFALCLVLLSILTFAVPADGQCELAKLIASDGAQNDRFAGAVAVSGNVALIGSGGSDGLVGDTGSAYIYRFNGSEWTEQTKLTASDGAPYDNFGGAVAVNGDIAVVGATGDDFAACSKIYIIQAQVPRIYTAC